MAGDEINTEWITSLRIIMGGVERMMQTGARIALVVTYPLAATPRREAPDPGENAPPPSTGPEASRPSG